MDVRSPPKLRDYLCVVALVAAACAPASKGGRRSGAESGDASGGGSGSIDTGQETDSAAPEPCAEARDETGSDWAACLIVSSSAYDDNYSGPNWLLDGGKWPLRTALRYPVDQDGPYTHHWRLSNAGLEYQGAGDALSFDAGNSVASCEDVQSFSDALVAAMEDGGDVAAHCDAVSSFVATVFPEALAPSEGRHLRALVSAASIPASMGTGSYSEPEIGPVSVSWSTHSSMWSWNPQSCSIGQVSNSFSGGWGTTTTEITIEEDGDPTVLRAEGVLGTAQVQPPTVELRGEFENCEEPQANYITVVP